MIIKGASRAAPAKLANHLEREDTNERVEMLEFRDVPFENLDNALRHMQALTAGTRGFKGLYHANIDPHADYPMTQEQWFRAADVLEKELGLDGQPRVIVLHKKEGREHIHVVWARTDLETLTLRSDSRTYAAHERASARLEEEFGHEHVPGKWHKRDMDKELPMAELNHVEWQQKTRSGLDPRLRKEEITGLYERADNGHALKAALEDAGYVLANGDRRALVVVDIAGEVHSLNRQIATAKAKDIHEKIADLDPASLPDVAEARELQQQRREARRSASGRAEAEQGREGASDAPEAAQGAQERPEGASDRLPALAPPDDPVLVEARAELDQNHDRRRAKFEKDWQDRIEREMDLVDRQIQEKRDIERKVDWKQMEPGKGIERFEHKLKDRLDPKRISDRYDERQRREGERDARDTQRREARLAELVREREQYRERMERTFEREHSQLDDMHRRDQERARSQELDRARDPKPPEDRPPDRGGGYDR
ncbi:MAG: relaxase/mobilization nuclease domain-containing protein [Alphaproteobacteria bacterium]|nr:relaxase/mobilization nuclease domain-containing protein [Alphaproteobacteria bacterium]